MTGEMTKVNLENLGYDEFFDSNWKSLKLSNSFAARVIAEHKGSYKVKSPKGEYLAKVTGKQMFVATSRIDYPAVGDWVALSKLDDKTAIIHNILKRKTILWKKYSNKQDIQIIATNIDTAFIVESLNNDYNLNRFERYFVLAKEGGIEPTIILNKIDLVSEDALNQKINQVKERFDNVDVLLTSAKTEEGVNDLAAYIKKGKTYCFIGSSGVGKSSLINKLLKNNAIKTKEISDSSGKGKHVTTAREMYFLKNGGIVIDNPGTREVGIANSSYGIKSVFDEITFLSKECRYHDCSHVHEPGCAVLKAVKEKRIDDFKYQNYLKLKKENEFYEMTDFEKRKKDRKFGQFVKKALAQSREINP